MKGLTVMSQKATTDAPGKTAGTASAKPPLAKMTSKPPAKAPAKPSRAAAAKRPILVSSDSEEEEASSEDFSDQER